MALKEHCHSEGGFDIGKFECVFKENDIDSEPRPENSRLNRKVRMNGRQKLAAVAQKRIHFSQSC
jgi:hypothetical protein